MIISISIYFYSFLFCIAHTFTLAAKARAADTGSLVLIARVFAWALRLLRWLWMFVVVDTVAVLIATRNAARLLARATPGAATAALRIRPNVLTMPLMFVGLAVVGWSVAQSVVWNGTYTGQFTVPNSAPFTGINSTSMIWDYRILDWTYSPTTCTDLSQEWGSLGAGHSTLKLCPTFIFGGMLLWNGPDNVSSPPITFPPGSTITAISQTNPAVFTLSGPLLASTMVAGKKVVLGGIYGSGCSGLDGQSPVISSVTATTFTVPLNATGCFYNSFTVTNATWSGGLATITIGSHAFQDTQNVNVTGISPVGFNGQVTIVSHTSTTITYAITNPGSSYVSGGTVSVSQLGRAMSNDFLVRVHRDVPLMSSFMEIWNVDGTGYQTGSTAILSLGTVSLPQTYQVADSNTHASFAFKRWYSGTLAAQSKPPWGVACNISGLTCLQDLEFEGTGADSSGNGLTLGYSSVAVYANTPAYAPACNAGPQQSIKSATALTLDGSLSFPIDGGATLTYLWSQGTYTQAGIASQLAFFSSTVVVNPIVTGLVSDNSRGPFNVNLTVVDESMNSSSCFVHHGVVNTDDTGRISYNNTQMGSIVGPQMRYGASVTWSWLDTVNKQWADQIGQAQGTHQTGGLVVVSDFFDTTTDGVAAWNTAQAGTVSITNGNSVVAGSSTTFKDTFCASGTLPTGLGQQQFVGWYTYTLSGGGGGTGRRAVQIAACPSQTVLLLGAGANHIVSLTSTNPAVLTLDSPTPFSNGATLQISQATGAGCSGLNGLWAISGVSGSTVTVAFDATGCTYTGSSAYLYGPTNWVPPTQSGMNYSLWPNSGFGSWINGSHNINYYDNVLSFYSFYLRTGIEDYLGYARWLADRWWLMPLVDRGNSNDCEANASLCNNASLFPRVYSMMGLYMRALDQDIVAGSPGSSPMWAGIRQVTSAGANHGVWRYTPNLTAPIGDLRETAYNHMFIAACAAYDPDATQRANCLADLSTVLGIWTGERQSNGSWNALGGYFTNTVAAWPDIGNNNQSGTVTVAQSSNTITLVGGAWGTCGTGAGTCAFPNGGTATFYSFKSFTDASTRDSQIYTATYVDSNHATISPAYVDNCASAGNSCSGRNWVLSVPNIVIGFGTQPYMLGIAGNFFNQAYIAFSQDPSYTTQAALAKSYVIDTAKWVSTSALDGSGGTDPATRGSLYAVGFGICNPGTDALGCRCGPSNPDCGSTIASRENMGEALGDLGIAYGYSGSSSLKTAIDNVFGACYGKFSTDVGYDGTYCSELDATGFFPPTYNSKWLGFFWGTGRNDAYENTRAITALLSALSGTVVVSGSVVIH